MIEMLEGPSLIYYVIKSLRQKYPDKQIGKTVVQKIMYLLETKSDLDFDYTLYYYGPYSFKVGEYLNLAETLKFIDIKWNPEKGYFIEPLHPDPQLLHAPSENLLKVIDNLVDKYGKFKANDLSLIATAFYVKNKMGIKSLEELSKMVLQIKPKNREEHVEELLKQGDVIEF